jgi:hypothetical protein
MPQGRVTNRRVDFPCRPSQDKAYKSCSPELVRYATFSILLLNRCSLEKEVPMLTSDDNECTAMVYIMAREEQLKVRLTKEEMERLEAYAKSKGYSKSEVIRDYIKRLPK